MLHAIGRMLILCVLKHRDAANKMLAHQQIDGGGVRLNTEKMLFLLRHFEEGIRLATLDYHTHFYSIFQLNDKAHLNKIQVVMDKLIASVGPFIHVEPAHNFEDTSKWEKKCSKVHSYLNKFLFNLPYTSEKCCGIRQTFHPNLKVHLLLTDELFSIKSHFKTEMKSAFSAIVNVTTLFIYLF